MPSGWTFRVVIDKFYGQGPWNDRWGRDGPCEPRRIHQVARAGYPVDGGPERSLLVFDTYRSIDDVQDDDWVREDLASRSPYVLLGSDDAMIDALIERRERWGLSYIVCFENDLEAFLPLVRKLA